MAVLTRMVPERKRPRLLCVDDEPQVLEGLCLHLARRYDVVTRTSGASALEFLREDPDVAVILSDMRMPGMDGARFLAQSREFAPHAVRLLLTGQTEMKAAVDAVNEGQIFRFLTKPCPPPTLLGAVEAAIEQNRLITAEKVLLEQTLQGSIQALVDVLGLTNPLSFGRSTRIKKSVTALCEKLSVATRWPIEMAAMLSQLGFITLPESVVEKVYTGRELDEAERAMLKRVPAVTEQLLNRIPRLEEVREILLGAPRAFRKNAAGEVPKDAPPLGARILRVALDFDALEIQGHAPAVVTETLCARPNLYDPDVLEALRRIHASEEAPQQVKEVQLAALRVGMVIVDDLRMTTGMLIVPKGYEITESFVARVLNFSRGTVKEPIRVLVRAN